VDLDGWQEMAFIETTTSTRLAPAPSRATKHCDLPPGCWLVTPRRFFTHHGIYAGDGRVVHYSGLSRTWRRGPVQVVSLEEFCGGRGVWIRAAPGARYRVMTNNCEHFCTWCVDGESCSSQVERWLAWPRAIAGAAFAAMMRLFDLDPRVPAPLMP